MTVVELALREPLEARSVLGVLAAHAVPRLEQVDPLAGTVRRFLTLPGGPAVVTVTLTRSRVTVQTDHEGEGPGAVALVRRWLDLDRDLAPVRALLAADPVLAPMVAARPGLRVTGYPDPFEGAVLTVLGQQVSVAAARTCGARLVQRYADPHAAVEELRPFPVPEVLARADPGELRAVLGVPAARARTVLALARACADGLLADCTGDRSGDRAETRRRLLALPGIGPWTADYLALRALGDADAFPATDLVLRRALGGVTGAEATRAATAWSPYRAYAAVHLWADAVYR